MFYDEEKTITACDNDPSLIFELLREEHMELLDKIISRKNFDINVLDTDGNNIVMKLLKKGQYKLVLKHLKNKKLDINHQNNDGNTLAHILISGFQLITSILTLPIISNLVAVNKSVFGFHWQIVAYVIVIPVISGIIIA